MNRLPPKAGINLQPEHYHVLLENQLNIAWLEIQAEDYFGQGGAPHFYLEKLSRKYPLSFHGHGLSLGSAESVSGEYLRMLKALNERYRPYIISETLSWSRWQGLPLSEPLPLPYDSETLDQVSINIRRIQSSLGRRILIENPSNYLTFSGNGMTEGDFFEELLRQTGCGLLLDLNNLYVSAMNAGLDPSKVVATYPLAAVQEIHLSGHSFVPLDDDNMLLVTDHAAGVWKPVWQLYRETLAAMPKPVATLIEWRARPAALEHLVPSVIKANSVLNEFTSKADRRP